MPALGGMYTKTKHLEGLRTVRLTVVIDFKKLKNEEEIMRWLLSQFSKARHGSHHQLESGNRRNTDTGVPPPSYQRGGEIHYNS